MIHAPRTKSQLGILAVRVNWVRQCRTAHLKVKEVKNVLGLLTSFYCCSLSLTITVPRRIAAENITVTYTVKPNVLQIHIDVSSHPLEVLLLQPESSTYNLFYRWITSAPEECQSSFSSLWWLLKVFQRNQTCHMTQDKQLQTSPSVYPKLWMCVPFMWGSVQETVLDCLHPVKQLKLVSCNSIIIWSISSLS